MDFGLNHLETIGTEGSGGNLTNTHTNGVCVTYLFGEMNWNKSKKTDNGKKKYKIVKGFAYAYKVVV